MVSQKTPRFKIKVSKVFLNLRSYTFAKFADPDVHRRVAMDALSMIDHSFCGLPSMSSHTYTYYISQETGFYVLLVFTRFFSSFLWEVFAVLEDWHPMQHSCYNSCQFSMHFCGATRERKMWGAYFSHANPALILHPHTTPRARPKPRKSRTTTIYHPSYIPSPDYASTVTTVRSVSKSWIR